jgi:predicted CopG family antitoxin
VGWKIVRVRDKEYEELKRLKEERGLFSFNDVIVELLKCGQAGRTQVESVERHGVEDIEVVRLGFFAHAWLTGLRKQLQEMLGIELSLYDVLDIIGFAMTRKNERFYLDAMMEDSLVELGNIIRSLKEGKITMKDIIKTLREITKIEKS